MKVETAVCNNFYLLMFYRLLPEKFLNEVPIIKNKYMKRMPRLLSVLLLLSVITSCGKHTTPQPSPAELAQSYISNARITDSVQAAAVKVFVNQLENSSLWSKFLAIYPMIGGTTSSTKWNLKDPRDADEAYRLTFHGSPAFADTGVLFPTIADYADTHLNDNTLQFNNSSISYYSLTQNAISGYDIGCNDNIFPYNEFAIYHAADAAEWFGYHALAITPAVTKGFFMLSATENDVKRYDNSVVVNSRGASPKNGSTNFPVLIGNVARDSVCGQKVCALATIGYGFTDQEVITLNQIVHDFELALKRK
jgi:hypothetical protein